MKRISKTWPLVAPEPWPDKHRADLPRGKIALTMRALGALGQRHLYGTTAGAIALETQPNTRRLKLTIKPGKDVDMASPQSFRVYCSDIQCGYERLSSVGTVPIKSRRHRKMNYVGMRRIGITSWAIMRIFDSGNPAELGSYHLYSCPVCGREATYLQKWGVMRRVE